jgi:porin
MARNGSHYERLQEQRGITLSGSETVLEANYLVQISQWLSVQPDVQYIVRPSGNPAIKDALVLKLRFEVLY